MAKFIARANREKERGMALLLAMFALLLLSAIGLCMVLASNTETRIDANYSGNLRDYYAARSGIEEVRDRMKIPSTSANSLSGSLPTDIAGNANGVLYIVNAVNGEAVDPTDSSSAYFDDQLCHDYNSGVAAPDSKCTVVPSTQSWMAWQPAAPVPAGSLPLGYKWTRITLKTNRIAAPYYVDGNGASAALDTRVCWDGETEQLSPGAANSPCDANGMQQVYMLTSLAVSPQPGGLNGSRKLLRAEVVAPSIRPPGAVTMEVGASTNSNPVAATFNNVVLPSTSIDGNVHNADGTPSANPACSTVAALAANTSQGTASLQTALNSLRRTIVDAANTSCDANGNSISPKTCTPPLAWVRGTNTNFRYTTPPATPSAPAPTPTPAPMPTATPAPSPTPFSSSHSGHGGDDDNPPPRATPTPTPTPAPTPMPGNPNDCDVSVASCYKNLDLSAAPLSPGAPLFAGSNANSGDPEVYQAKSASIVANASQAVFDYVAARKASNANYFELASTSLDPTVVYGTSDQPDVLVISDSSLTLNTNLTGVGILVVPNYFEINAGLNWSGIVVVRPATGLTTGQFLINAGAAGSINGAVILQAGSTFTLTSSTAPAPGTPPGPIFRVAYSCEAIDKAMGSRPLKIVGQSETSF